MKNKAAKIFKKLLKNSLGILFFGHCPSDVPLKGVDPAMKSLIEQTVDIYASIAYPSDSPPKPRKGFLLSGYGAEPEKQKKVSRCRVMGQKLRNLAIGKNKK